MTANHSYTTKTLLRAKCFINYRDSIHYLMSNYRDSKFFTIAQHYPADSSGVNKSPSREIS